MSKPGTATEPSVDDILSSIRQDIADNPDLADDSSDPLLAGSDFLGTATLKSDAARGAAGNANGAGSAVGTRAVDARSTLRDRLSDALGRPAGSSSPTNKADAGTRGASAATRDELHDMLDEMASGPGPAPKPKSADPKGFTAKSVHTADLVTPDLGTEPTTIVVPASAESANSGQEAIAPVAEAEGLDFSALLGGDAAGQADTKKAPDQIADIPLNGDLLVADANTNPASPSATTARKDPDDKIDAAAGNSDADGASPASEMKSSPAGIGFVAGLATSPHAQDTYADAASVAETKTSSPQDGASVEPRSMDVLSPTSQARRWGAAVGQPVADSAIPVKQSPVDDSIGHDGSTTVAELNPSASALDALVAGLATSNLAVAQEEAKKSAGGDHNRDVGTEVPTVDFKSVGSPGGTGTVKVKLQTDQQTLDAARQASDSSVQGLEDTVTELLRPMLREWLEANMPRIVENALRIEVSQSNDSGSHGA